MHRTDKYFEQTKYLSDHDIHSEAPLTSMASRALSGFVSFNFGFLQSTGLYLFVTLQN